MSEQSSSHNDEQGSVTRWITSLKQGDVVATEEIWRRYFPQLSQFANQHLGNQRQLSDGEDIALSTFEVLFRGVADGQFRNLNDRADLWALLIFVARRKAIDAIRHENAEKRGGGKVKNETSVSAESGFSLQQLISSEPTPRDLAMLREHLVRLMTLLKSDQLRQIANAKLEGHSNSEIAKDIGLTARSIARKVQLIRSCWAEASSAMFFGGSGS